MGSHKKHRKRSETTSEESEDDDKNAAKKKKHSSNKKRAKKRKRESSTSSSETSSSSEEEKRRKRKKKQKKLKKKASEDKKEETSTDIPLDLMNQSKSMAPMTKEEWEKRQNVVRRVYDETTGRYRLIKGDGEVIEEPVSRERHKAINQQATRGDGEYFQTQVANRSKK